MVEDLEVKVKTFEDLVTADIFYGVPANVVDGRSRLCLKLRARYNSGGGFFNAVGTHDGELYLFLDNSKVEFKRHSWEWSQGYQVTEKCLECGRPREKT